MEELTGNELIRDDEIFLRMNLAERVQHILLIFSFSLLVLTGLPLMFYELHVFKSIFGFAKAFYYRGVLHRFAAVILIVDIVWHFGYTILTRRGRDNFKEMIPRPKDALDAMVLFGYNVGLAGWLSRKGFLKAFFKRHPFWKFEKPPEYGRYNFIEKFEYLAVGWGSFVMIISGFFMWNVEFSLKIFPLWVHDIFVIVHGYEAMLAFLAIIIWHMYNVHLNPEVFPLSKIWINGKITGHELKTLHALEYRKILADRKEALEAPEMESAPDPAP
ncbi:MAG TPA: cytochrome b/b6 domain-containing protein [Acidobacteriota bacterium]|nr:cytochrome b/b6 domain-containing protein [Acidobacteriota bacterium]